MSLALLRENLRYRLTNLLFDNGIRIQQRHTGALAERLAHSRLAAAHQTNQNDGTPLGIERMYRRRCHIYPSINPRR